MYAIICMYVCMLGLALVSLCNVCMFVRIHDKGLCVCMYVCIYMCMYVCNYLSIGILVYMNVCMYVVCVYVGR
jgi:hypothetical protein